MPRKSPALILLRTTIYKFNESLINGHTFIDKFDYEVSHGTFLEIYLIKLDKIKNIVYNHDENKRFVRWLNMINAEDMNELKNIAEEDELMESAVRLMEDFLSDEELQDEFDKITDIEYYAKEEGILEEKRKTAKNLLDMDIPIFKIVKATGLSEEEIESLE